MNALITETPTGTEPITMSESNRLIELERRIEAGLKTYREVGAALLEIHDARLYKIEHLTFEAYCRDKWGMGKAYAFRQIAASEAVKNLSPIGDIKPTTESQARPLTKLPPEQHPVAWARAVEIAVGQQPTGKQVEEAVLEIVESDSRSAMPTASLANYSEEDLAYMSSPFFKTQEKIKALLEKLPHVTLENIQHHEWLMDDLSGSVLPAWWGSEMIEIGKKRKANDRAARKAEKLKENEGSK